MAVGAGAETRTRAAGVAAGRGAAGAAGAAGRDAPEDEDPEEPEPLARRWTVRRTTSVRTSTGGSAGAAVVGEAGVMEPAERAAAASAPRQSTVTAAAILKRVVGMRCRLNSRLPSPGERATNHRQPSVKSRENLWPAPPRAPTLTLVATRPRILFVEDERSISEPFSKALTREGYDPVVAGTAAEALALAQGPRFDLVLLDLTLPDGDGRDVCRELRRSSDVPIVMLTARGTELDRIVGLELGADDYVVKPFSGAEVIARIRAVLRRTQTAQTPEAAEAVTQVADLHVDHEARRVRLNGTELELSRKEFDLLARLVRDAGRVVTREQLMSDVWDENWFGPTKTLDVHVGWLRKKLGDDPASPAWIETVRGVGFRFRAP